MKKDLTVILSSQDGTFKKTISVFEMGNFSKYINGGLSDLKLKVPITMDSTDIGDGIALYNDVEIRLSDTDTPSQGIIIYKGYISGYGPYVDGHKEGTDIFILPYTSVLSDDIWEEDYVALDFVAANPDYVSVADNAAHDITDTLTLECWFKTDTADFGYGKGMVLHDESNYKYMLYMYGSDPAVVSFGLRTATGLKYITAGSNYGYNDGNWHYVVVIWTKPNLSMYIDGKLVNTAVGNDEDVTAGDEGLTIGSYWEGQMMNIRVANIARKPDEISMNYKKGQKFTADTGTFACYHFDEGTGSAVVDESATQDGVVNGADWLTAQQARCTINQEGIDPSTMLESLVDDYRAKATNAKINYDTDSIDDTSTTQTYRFQSEQFLDSINVIRGLSPLNWYWHLGADGLMQFHAKPATATHTLVVGREINTIRPIKNMENVKNCYLFWNTIHSSEGKSIFKRYKDATSIASYDYHYAKAVDSRYEVESTVSAKATAFINSNKDPVVRAVITVIDNNSYDKGYDIESIVPGDTCKILNLSPTAAQFFDDNMTIVAVHYTDDLTRAELEIETVPRQLASEHREAQKRLEGRTEQDMPPFYTE